jgi:choline dehydrogenase-like flavoprotein
MVGTIFGLENIEKRKENYSLVTHEIVENADVCVIGSGAAGAIVAAKLAGEGKAVVLLEKGGYYDAEDMNQREADMMPLLWKNGGANFTDDLKIVIAQGQCLGGSTVINDAICLKIPLIVRDQWRRMGVDISDEQWDKAIDEVWREIHVSKVTEEELNDNNLMLKRACQLKRYKASENDRNCIDCMRCGFCNLGCHYDTKQSMLVTYIHRALQNPTSNIRIYCNCGAEKITYSGAIVNGVEGNFIDSSGDIKFKIRVNAKAVVISAGAIASSQILMKNKIARGKAGKGLGLHPAPFLLGKFDKKINAYNGIPMAYACHEFGVTNNVVDGGFLIESISVSIFLLSVGLQSFFEGLRLMKDYIYYTMAVVLIRDDADGTITLSEKGNPKVHYRLSQKDVDTMAKGLEILAQMWFDVGAQHVISGHKDIIKIDRKEDIPKLVQKVKKNPDGLWLASSHPQGGNRMGQDSSNCVVDSNCKVHGFSNLYVCDASVFPTTLGINPQITVMALAAMTADYINNKWNSEYAE